MVAKSRASKKKSIKNALKKDTKMTFVENSASKIEISDLGPSLQEKCRHYYSNSRAKYNKFFLDCLKDLEELQPTGFACIKASRYFTVGVLPEYCIIPDTLTKKQRQRVERLLRDKVPGL